MHAVVVVFVALQTTLLLYLFPLPHAVVFLTKTLKFAYRNTFLQLPCFLKEKVLQNSTRANLKIKN